MIGVAFQFKGFLPEIIFGRLPSLMLNPLAPVIFLQMLRVYLA